MTKKILENHYCKANKIHDNTLIHLEHLDIKNFLVFISTILFHLSKVKIVNITSSETLFLLFKKTFCK